MKRFFHLPIFLMVSFSVVLVSCTRSAANNQNTGIFPTPFAPGSDFEKTGIPEDTAPTLGVNQTAIKLIETGYLGETLLIFSLKIPEEMDQEYYGKVQGEIYDCTRQEELPNSLYCFGQVPESRLTPIFQLFSPAEDELVWQTDFIYPDIDNQ